MKLFYELFPETEEILAFSELSKHGITIEDPGKHRFSNINIVIGPNGAGKTRFLEAVRDLYKGTYLADVLYCYFPDLSSRKFVKSEKAPLPRFSLKNYMDRDGISFENFVKAIEEQGETFLLGLLKGDSGYEVEENRQRLERMDRFASSFLGKNMVRSLRGVAGRILRSREPVLVIRKAFGSGDLELAEALEQFSPGERMLFYMALFLTLKKDPKDKVKQTIILDEPETHLHPDALLKFVTALKEEFPDADIWIATHSLLLVPKFKFEEIVYIENSQIIRRNSKIYDKIMSGMLGEGNDDVRQFFASRAQWQYYEYLTECFRAPKVVDTVDPADPQVQMFLRSEEDREIKKVLDFGGGSGRLGRSLEAAHIPQWKDTVYHIVDKDPTLAAEGFTVFTDLKDADKDYDCIVMMNVLHELEPDGWVALFHEFQQHMTEDAELLIVEVDALREGERPNDTGYILLGEPELMALFKIKEFATIPGSAKNPHADSFVFDHEDISNVSRATVLEAIKGLEARTYQEIKDIRDNKNESVDARRYAFLLQQYINAKLFNERMAEDSTADQGRTD